MFLYEWYAQLWRRAVSMVPWNSYQNIQFICMHSHKCMFCQKAFTTHKFINIILIKWEFIYDSSYLHFALYNMKRIFHLYVRLFVVVLHIFYTQKPNRPKHAYIEIQMWNTQRMNEWKSTWVEKESTQTATTMCGEGGTDANDDWWYGNNFKCLPMTVWLMENER